MNAVSLFETLCHYCRSLRATDADNCRTLALRLADNHIYLLDYWSLGIAQVVLPDDPRHVLGFGAIVAPPREQRLVVLEDDHIPAGTDGRIVAELARLRAAIGMVEAPHHLARGAAARIAALADAVGHRMRADYLTRHGGGNDR